MVLFPFLRRELPDESFIAKYFESQGEPAIYEEPTGMTELTANSNLQQIREEAANSPPQYALAPRHAVSRHTPIAPYHSMAVSRQFSI